MTDKATLGVLVGTVAAVCAGRRAVGKAIDWHDAMARRVDGLTARLDDVEAELDLDIPAPRT
ncbi:hypothetical protein [Kutzneria chonburiensis]|uniref:Uncharacterized protein n=1 Tax=Kutzneria chonburiensis TaxID=1483604 RepID=A0ABV6N2V8_9PSEU|nr:hypothetical protein [Kutzneria chonburiensis]